MSTARVFHRMACNSTALMRDYFSRNYGSQCAYTCSLEVIAKPVWAEYYPLKLTLKLITEHNGKLVF